MAKNTVQQDLMQAQVDLLNEAIDLQEKQITQLRVDLGKLELKVAHNEGALKATSRRSAETDSVLAALLERMNLVWTKRPEKVELVKNSIWF